MNILSRIWRLLRGRRGETAGFVLDDEGFVVLCTLSIRAEALPALDELRERSGAADYAELVQQALHAYEVSLDAAAKYAPNNRFTN